jgi:hypothetical protein
VRFAYADPPYLGLARLYADRHPEAMIWDDPETHRKLIERLCDEYADGWFLSLHEPTLRVMLNMCPDDVRVGSWVKPFASFKPNVTRAWTWEPVIFRGGRKRTREQGTWRDHLACNITLRKGLPGAKPWAFCEWVLDGLNYQTGDTLDDLFPGTGIMGEVVKARDGAPMQVGLFAEVTRC